MINRLVSILEQPQLTDGCVTSDKLSDRAVLSAHLSEGIVGSEHIGSEAVCGSHIRERSVQFQHLAYQPVATASKEAALQQFGLCDYEFAGQSEQTDIPIKFEIPFLSEQYSIIATTDHPACYATIKEKRPDGAVLCIVRTRFGPEPKGTVNWVAIGRHPMN
ncbi:WIAG-tail domain [Paenibacillus cisolokensis]|nr:WIAG-tail domain [Paenibacillus cisolokensis]